MGKLPPYLFTLLVLFGAVTSCSSIKNKSEEKLYPVTLSFFIHTPYCGGAYPGPEQQKGYTNPMNLYEFALYEAAEQFGFHQHTNKLIQKFKVDSKGEILLNLAPGNYYVVLADKALPFKTFYTKNDIGDGVTNNSSDEACFLQWYRTPDFRFTVIRAPEQKHSRTFNAFCYNGLNPCVYYIGPLPPSSPPR